jgi:plasmid segregation protein ParM
VEIIGLDIGYGYTKASDGRRAIVFKSIYGEATEPQFRDEVLDHPEEEMHLHVELNGKGYFVGEHAVRQSAQRNFTLDPNQFVAEFTRILALAPLARMVDRQNQIKLVAGLPISHYRKHKADLIKTLQGQHPVTVIDKLGNRIETVVRIAEVKVVPQPYGSVLNMMLTDLGEMQDKRFLTEKIGVIDIGFRTTDFTVVDHTHYSERGSRTVDAGMSRAYSNVAAKVLETSGVNVELYRMYESVERGSIKIHGKRYDLKGVRDRAFEQLASAIATDANRLWAADWDMDRILLSGGGGAVIAPFLAPLIKGELVPVEAGADGRLNNVKGYVKYGRRMWSRTAADKAAVG